MNSRPQRCRVDGAAPEPDHPYYELAERLRVLLVLMLERSPHERHRDGLVRVAEGQVFESGAEDTPGPHPLAVQLLLPNSNGRYEWTSRAGQIRGIVSLQFICVSAERLIMLDCERGAKEFSTSGIDAQLKQVCDSLGIPPVGSVRS